MRTHYPIRLKPRGANRLETLREQGVNHIELRMIDLNPLRKEGINVRDVKFANCSSFGLPQHHASPSLRRTRCRPSPTSRMPPTTT